MTTLTCARKNHLPVILQSENNECGLACLAMVLNFHGYSTTLGNLRSSYPVSMHGFALNKLMHLADRLHLACRAVRLEREDLPSLVLPAILHWDMKHFVVLRRLSRKGVLIHDPAKGELQLSWQAFDEHFTGVALELQPASSFTKIEKAPRLLFTSFWKGCQGLWGALCQILFLSLLLQVFAFSLPYYTQLFIDDVVVSADRSLLKILAAGFLMVVLARSLTELLRSWVVMHLGNNLSLGFGTSLCRHLLALPLDWFQDRHLGDIVSRFGSLTRVKDFMTSGLVEVMVDGLMVIGTLILMFVYSTQLTLIALAGVFIYGGLRLLMHRQLRARNNEQIHASAIENSLFMENVRALQGIRMFGREADRLASWQNTYTDVINAGVRVQWLGIYTKFAHGLLMGSENILLLMFGGMAVLDNNLSVGMLMAYMSFKDQCYTRVFGLIDKLCEFRLLELHLERLADIALEKTETGVQGQGLPLTHDSNGLCLEARDLGFRFQGEDRWLFRHLDLVIEPGESVAIVGPTGCGKSTLLKILLGLRKEEEGQLQMAGTSLEQIGLHDWRASIAGVLQDDVVLSGSLLENITFFDPEPDLARVEEAASLAAIAHDIHGFPMQYNTLVGSMGAALSGGQIQRLLLARALYRKPRLLILDEATSHLDIATERQVNDSIRNMGASRLLVAHRPDSILLADRILVLDSGGLLPISHERFMTVSGSRGRAA